jgi:GDP-D-mannose 3', 5'-epimerase
MKAVVFGSNGFIGGHLVRRLKAEGYWVRGVDNRQPDVTSGGPDEFIHDDLTNRLVVECAIDDAVDEVYQLAAEMGGAGYIFTGINDARIMHVSALINLHTADVSSRVGVGRVFYASSACIYPRANQQDPATARCDEDSAYPADPDSEYGWEKLFSERLYGAFRRNAGLDARVARLHNVYGPGNAWRGGREKAPAALCRKVAAARDGDAIEIWGDGAQCRSFLYVDDCVDGIRALMCSGHTGPVNIGSEYMISIDDLARMIIRIAGKNLTLHHVAGPIGVRGRKSDNQAVFAATGWRPQVDLEDGIARTYRWIASEVDAGRRSATPEGSTASV